jgi:hypothetical protein
MICQLSNEPFNSLVASGNAVTPLLLAHLFGLQVVLTPILSRTWEKRKMIQPVGHRLDWVLNLYDSASPQEKRFLYWPEMIARRARIGMTANGMLAQRVIREKGDIPHETVIEI